jgi:hypothetical protein
MSSTRADETKVLKLTLHGKLVGYLVGFNLFRIYSQPLGA